MRGVNLLLMILLNVVVSDVFVYWICVGNCLVINEVCGLYIMVWNNIFIMSVM